MKVTYQWLKDFVDIKIPVQALADKLTMAGLEVVGIEKHGEDSVLEIEITSNRPDWLSIIGVAREVATLTGSKVCSPHMRSVQANIKGASCVTITIEDAKDCPLYSAKIIEGVTVGASPAWLRARLESIGCRSINNVVDIANYCMFERGEPLHAFNLDALTSGTIYARRAREGEKITTLDGVERVLDAQVLVIANAKNPVAVAGVIGGKETEVTSSTKRILLEAAVFNPALIRKSRQKLGVQTDSSYRFERGVDSETALDTSNLAASMILKLCGGSLTSASCAGKTRVAMKKISLSLDRLHALLGAPISETSARKILANLGFSVARRSKGVFLVGVPAFRRDIGEDVDLIEEVARMYGFERIVSALPKISPQASEITERDLRNRVASLLCGLGLQEVITHSLVGRQMVRGGCFVEQSAPGIANPLHSDQSQLRTSLIPGLLGCIAHNLNQKQFAVAVFEIAKVFSLVNNAPQERWHIGIGISGEYAWVSSAGKRTLSLDAQRLKGIIEALQAGLHIEGLNWQEDSAGFAIVRQGERIGCLCAVPDEVLGAYDIKQNTVFIAQLDLEKLLPLLRATQKFKPLPRFPSVVRDISIMVKDAASLAEIVRAARATSPLIEEIAVIDFYQGKQIPQGSKALTLSCVYRSHERTLTEEEIVPVHQALTHLLSSSFNATIR